LRCFANEQTRVDFGDLRPEDSGLVSLNCRTDAVRDTSINLRELIDPDVKNGRIFSGII
jgi:hypothetical protein